MTWPVPLRSKVATHCNPILTLGHCIFLGLKNPADPKTKQPENTRLSSVHLAVESEYGLPMSRRYGDLPDRLLTHICMFLVWPGRQLQQNSS